MSKVTVEGGWDDNDVGWDSLVDEVLGKSGSFGVSMGGTDKNDTSDSVLLAGFSDSFELLLLELDVTGVSKII